MIYHPESLLRPYSYWRGVFYFRRSVCLGGDRRVFDLLMQVVMSPEGALTGQEESLSLVLIVGTLRLGTRMGMAEHMYELFQLFHRYRAVRIFRTNPHNSQGDITLAHHRFRSDEIYRAWALVRARNLVKFLPANGLVRDYWLTIPERHWELLTRGFDPEFCLALDDHNANSDGEAADVWPQESLKVFQLVHERILWELSRRRNGVNQRRPPQ